MRGVEDRPSSGSRCAHPVTFDSSSVWRAGSGHVSSTGEHGRRSRQSGRELGRRGPRCRRRRRPRLTGPRECRDEAGGGEARGSRGLHHDLVARLIRSSTREAFAPSLARLLLHRAVGGRTMYEGTGPHAWREGRHLAKSKVHRLVDGRAVAVGIHGLAPSFSVSACLSPCLALPTVIFSCVSSSTQASHRYLKQCPCSRGPSSRGQHPLPHRSVRQWLIDVSLKFAI